MTLIGLDDPARPANPGRTISWQIPAAGPPWPLVGVDGDLIAWEFLTAPDPNPNARRRPWLVVCEQQGPVGVIRFAVPRLAPESRFSDLADYTAWERSTLDSPGSLEPVLELDAPTIGERLPPAKTKRSAFAAHEWGRRAQVREVVDRDLRGVLASTLLARDRPWLDSTDYTSRAPAAVKYDAARTARLRWATTRTHLAHLGALPWAAFPAGRLPKRWWADDRFATALDEWLHDAYLLYWRFSRERSPYPDLAARYAAIFYTRHARQRWSDPTTPDLDPETLAHARQQLASAARESCAENVRDWVAQLFGLSHHATDERDRQLRELDEIGAMAELRAAWQQPKTAVTN